VATTQTLLVMASRFDRRWIHSSDVRHWDRLPNAPCWCWPPKWHTTGTATLV